MERHRNKVDALISLIEPIIKSGYKIIVWSVYKHEIRLLKSILEAYFENPELVVTFYGDVSPKNRDERIEKFKTDPNCQIFLGHPGAGGAGINLVVTPYMVTYSCTWDPRHPIQSEARNHRIGTAEMCRQHGVNNCTIYYLQCSNTIDVLIHQALLVKQKVAEDFYEGIESMGEVDVQSMGGNIVNQILEGKDIEN